MILKVYVDKGLVKGVLYVFDNMGKCGSKLSLWFCNSLLSGLVKNCEYDMVVYVYD